MIVMCHSENDSATVGKPDRESYTRAADQARLARNAMVRTMAASGLSQARVVSPPSLALGK
jgi:hypothetical protein